MGQPRPLQTPTCHTATAGCLEPLPLPLHCLQLWVPGSIWCQAPQLPGFVSAQAPGLFRTLLPSPAWGKGAWGCVPPTVSLLCTGCDHGRVGDTCLQACCLPLGWTVIQLAMEHPSGHRHNKCKAELGPCYRRK